MMFRCLAFLVVRAVGWYFCSVGLLLVVVVGGLRESHSISWAGLDSLLLCSPG